MMGHYEELFTFNHFKQNKTPKIDPKMIRK